MKRAIPLVLLLLAGPLLAAAQAQDVKLLVDTIVVQAEGTYEADPDLATLTFVVFGEDKKLARAYELATEGLTRIVELAERNKVAKADVSAGVFSVTPLYDGKRKPRAYRVHTTVTIKMRDLSRVAFVIDDAVEAGVAELRSASYSLADEEQAKQKAVAEAMRRAQQRARTAVGENGRQLGELRYANLDVKQPVAMVQFMTAGVSPGFEEEAGAGGLLSRAKVAAPLPPIAPERITVRATAQCVFQIQ